MSLCKIISGGQTGVDRGALDACIATGTPYGGWCPKGGWAEDMRTPPGLLDKYPNLVETPQLDPRQRTEWNVRDSDGVLILVEGRGLAVSAGSSLTIDFAKYYGRPCLCLRLDDPASPSQVGAWLNDFLSLETLNIAGPRESEAPGICGASWHFVMQLLQQNE